MTESKLIERPSFWAAQVLPRTGQTVSYAAGDDGDLEKGFAIIPRYTNNGDGTVTDNATGLMWPQDWDGDGGNSGNAATWADALSFTSALDFAGWTDWRMPNINELFSVLDHGAGPPLVNAVFDLTGGDLFWSSTAFLAVPEFKQAMNPSEGKIQIDLNVLDNLIIAVRGG